MSQSYKTQPTRARLEAARIWSAVNGLVMRIYSAQGFLKVIGKLISMATFLPPISPGLKRVSDKTRIASLSKS